MGRVVEPGGRGGAFGAWSIDSMVQHLDLLNATVAPLQRPFMYFFERCKSVSMILTCYFKYFCVGKIYAWHFSMICNSLLIFRTFRNFAGLFPSSSSGVSLLRT